MSECTDGCPCPESKARTLLVGHGLGHVAQRAAMLAALAGMIADANGKCPQSCGSIWPECGCPTVGMKDLVLKMSEAPRAVRRRGSRGLSMLEMMAAGGATVPEPRRP